LTCSACGDDLPAGASFCEACGADLVAADGTAPASAANSAGAPPRAATPGMTVPGAITPGATIPGATTPAANSPAIPTPAAPEVTAPAGDESPLDIGWTGVVPGGGNVYEQAVVATPCTACGQGNYVDGYCDNCGAKQADPRDHFEESPATWVGGVCDIGRRHTRNEDALALAAEATPGSRAVLVVCDGVSNTTDSHVASLAGAKAARGILDKPLSAGVGTPEATKAAAVRRLDEAVQAANKAVIATVADKNDPNPPSCTFTGAIVTRASGSGIGTTGITAYVGNVGDSRIYWLPDGTEGAEQLSRDDSYAADRIAAGVERKEAETGPMAHSITRWLGIDAPDDITPHTREVAVDRPGWLMLCSDGLWNYCSAAADMQALVARLVAEGSGQTPTALAGALVDFANNAGGADNITVALARIDLVGPSGGDGRNG
ncbi:PP2C family serine/threonine-protein phosphatase, partial [Nostocoides jenkinsii]